MLLSKNYISIIFLEFDTPTLLIIINLKDIRSINQEFENQKENYKIILLEYKNKLTKVLPMTPITKSLLLGLILTQIAHEAHAVIDKKKVYSIAAVGTIVAGAGAIYHFTFGRFKKRNELRDQIVNSLERTSILVTESDQERKDKINNFDNQNPELLFLSAELHEGVFNETYHTSIPGITNGLVASEGLAKLEQVRNYVLEREKMIKGINL